MSTNKQVISLYLENQNIEWIKNLAEKFNRPTSYIIEFMVKTFKNNPEVIESMIEKQDITLTSLMDIYNDPEEKDYPLR